VGTQFVSEPIIPDAATFDTARMAAGEPGLPRRFTWRGDTIEVAEVVRTWKQTGDCRNGSREQYVHKHWYEIRTRTGETMTIYFERSFRSKPARSDRCWLFSTTK
jgi:phosphoribosylglycinamide formyltransferase-1